MTAPQLMNLHSQTTKSASALVRDAIGLGEKYGSGLRRVIATFVAYGLLEPVVEATQGGMAVTVFKQTGRLAPEKTGVGVNVGANVGASHLLAYIQTHPGQRASGIAAVYKLTQRTIERWLKQLKDQDLIEFRGATKTGGYYPKP